MSGTIVDRLITAFDLDSKGYEAGAKRVKDANAGLAPSMSSFANIGGAVAGTLTTAGLVGGAALVGLAVKASDTAEQYEVLARSLDVVTGSAERAAEVWDFVQKQAGPSAFFGVSELGNAAKALEVFKLRTEEFLPLANTMASMFGQNEESLMSFVYALGRIKAGSFGEGFERLREMGITKQMLEGEGLTFNSNNQYVGEADRALAAIKSAVTKNFGNLDKEMSSTSAAVKASFFDSINQSLAEIGGPLNEALKPLFADVTTELQKLKDSGALKEFGEKLGEVTTTLKESLPSLSTVQTNLEIIGAALPDIVNNFVNIAVSVGKVFDFFGRVFDDKPNNLWGPGAEEDAKIKSFSDQVAAQNAEMEKDPRVVAARERHEAREKAREAAKKASSAQSSKEVPPEIVKQTSILSEINSTLKKTYDMNRAAFGFGAGTTGYSAVDLSEFRKGRGGGNKVQAAIIGLTTAIQETMADEIMREQSRRAFA